MNGQKGKMTFMSLVAAAILVAGGFMAFKYLSTNLVKKQIKKEVFDTLGIVRGAEKTNADFVAAIEGVLEKKGVEILGVAAELSGSVIRYSFSYRIETDYLFFKHSEVIEVADEIASYG